MTRILVLHVPNGGGHRAAANAIAEAAAERAAMGEPVEVEVVDALEHTPRWWRQAYTKSFLRTTAQRSARGLPSRAIRAARPIWIRPRCGGTTGSAPDEEHGREKEIARPGGNPGTGRRGRGAEPREVRPHLSIQTG